MVTCSVSICLVLWASRISANTLQVIHSHVLGVSIRPNTTALASTTIPSHQHANVSAQKPLDIHCDGATYGFNLDQHDCESAHSSIFRATEQEIFGQRHSGLLDITWALPYIIMGGMVHYAYQHSPTVQEIRTTSTLNAITAC